ncbi:hypothetical protein [Streptomyces tsukubensis]|uniref:hypothetical protein n=1 Tax=Streptomyces tsukubensis TaxID=83656 RepID=UPI0015C3EE27|nr:hypothetical protein [Streptomyces tsukubensis]
MSTATSTAQHLATIGALCSREFPAQRGCPGESAAESGGLGGSQVEPGRSGEAPAEPARSEKSADGPAHRVETRLADGPAHRVETLLTSEEFLNGDSADRDAVQEQFEAERDGLTALLTRRWGEPHVFSLWSLRARTAAGATRGDAPEGDAVPGPWAAYDRDGTPHVTGEVIPDPWAALSECVPDLHLWHWDGRWVGLGIAHGGGEDPFRLLVFATLTDPP